ncbi:MAG: GDSL-type esterase/lipase family protein [Acidimicrobiales bacterium]|nr:GDSL-type esterase/lipase family protein [Acidimicrobiales bacterium]
MSVVRAVGQWFQARRSLVIAALSVVAIVALGIIVFGVESYGEAQTATTVEKLKLLVLKADVDAYRNTVRVDLVFAASYGVLGLVVGLRSGVEFRMVRVAGATLVAYGALLDEIENLRLLGNLGRYDKLTDQQVGSVAALGDPKWIAGLGGALLLFGCWAVAKLREPALRTAMGEWLGKSRAPYGAYLALAVAVVPISLAPIGDEAVIVALLVLLAVALVIVGSWLNETVGTSRAEAPSHGRARVAYAAIQLGVGIVATAVGWNASGYLLPAFFYLGVVLIVMSLGAFVSELRQGQLPARRRGPIVAGMGFVSLVVGVFLPPGPLFAVAVVVGVIAGELGTEVGSERFQLSHPDQPERKIRWQLMGLGVILLAIGVSSLVIMGADSSHVGLAVLALAAVVGMASVGGDGLVVVLAVVIALGWATAPEPANRTEALAPKAGEPYFAVLGDSYMSGEGANEYLAGTNEVVHKQDKDSDYTNECRRAETAWPFLLASDPTKYGAPATFPGRVAFLACSGAVSENIDTAPRLDDKGHQHGPAELTLLKDQMKELREAGASPEEAKPRFIILAIGGNDAGFGDIGLTCVGPGNCAEVAEQFLQTRLLPGDTPPEGRPEPLSEISDDLDGVYRRIQESVPGVPIVAVGYPRVIDDSPGRCTGALFHRDERAFINGFTEQLNLQVKAAATRAGAHYIDAESAMFDARVHLCGATAGAAGLNFVAFNSKGGTTRDALNPKNWFHNSIHPNPKGHDAVARKAGPWFSLNDPAKPAGQDPNDYVEVPPVDEVLEVDVPQCRAAHRESCDVNDGRWLLEQVQVLYGRALIPVALLVSGLWLLFAPALLWGRRNGLSVLGLIRRSPFGRLLPARAVERSE